MGLDGKILEYCYTYPNPDNMYTCINDGEGLEWPELNVQIDMGE